jgi:hypothetical protein
VSVVIGSLSLSDSRDGSHHSQIFAKSPGSSAVLGDADDDGLVDAEGLIDGLTDPLGDTLGDAEGEGVGDTDGDTDDDGLTLLLGLTDGEGDGEVDADGDIDGDDAEIDSQTFTPLVVPVSEYVWMQN